MVSTRFRRDRLAAGLSAVCALSFIALASACDKVPLLAPSGTVITIFPVSSTVALTAQAMLETGNGQSRWLAVFMKMFLFFCFCKRSSTRSIGCEYHGCCGVPSLSVLVRFTRPTTYA